MDTSGRLNGHDTANYRSRFQRLFAIILIAAAILVIRLAYLQVIKGEEYKVRSESNSVRLRKIKPFRGLIRIPGASAGDNQPAFDLVMYGIDIHGL